MKMTQPVNLINTFITRQPILKTGLFWCRMTHRNFFNGLVVLINHLFLKPRMKKVVCFQFIFPKLLIKPKKGYYIRPCVYNWNIQFSIEVQAQKASLTYWEQRPTC